MLLALLVATPGLAETRHYRLDGETAGVENGCQGWVLAQGDDCSYNASQPLGLGQTQWIGPIFSAAYYAPGDAPRIFDNPPVPAPVEAPAPVLPTAGSRGIAIRQAFLAIDDRSTAAGVDDVVWGTIEFDAFDRNVASSAEARLVEGFGRIIHRLNPVRVSAASANADGGWDYVVALADGAGAYPARLSGSTPAGGGFDDAFPSRAASQSSPDAADTPYWHAPSALGISAIEGDAHATGSRSTASVWGYSCEDGQDAGNPLPRADDCMNSPLAWNADRFAGFGNILLRLSTTAAGAISTAEALLVRDGQSTQAASAADGWVATRLDFTGTRSTSPLAFDDRAILLLPQTSVTVDVLANDLPGVAPVEVGIEEEPASGTASVAANRIVYQPEGTPPGPQEIGYRITDAEGNTATATLQVVIASPLACEDDSVDALPDTPVTVDVLANDAGSNFDIPPLRLGIAVAPAAGEAVVNADRSITFTPPPGGGGAQVMRYLISDGSGRATSCQLSIRLPATPQAVDDSVAVLQGGNILIDVLANDLEISDLPLTLDISRAPEHGAAQVEAGSNGPRIRYTPAAGHAGADSFEYTVTDADGDTSNPAIVTVDVVGAPNNDLPICANDEFTGERNTPLVLDVLANDSGLNALPITLGIEQLLPAGAATAEVNVDNTILFTPGTDRGGLFSLRYIVREAVNGAVRCTATIRVNDLPTASDDTYDAINFGSNRPLTLLANDQGLADTPLVLEITAQPAHASLRVCHEAGPDCPGFVAGSLPYVSYTYDDAAGFPASDEFRYRIIDADGDTSNEASVRITVKNEVEAANDPTGFEPAFAGLYGPGGFQALGHATSSGHSLRLDVLKNDSGLLNGPVSLSIATQPAAGRVVVNADNTLSYTAAGDHTGLVQFSYTVSDALGHSDTAVVAVYVFPEAKNKSGGSAVDPPLLMLLLGGLLLRGLRRLR